MGGVGKIKFRKNQIDEVDLFRTEDGARDKSALLIALLFQ